MASSSLRFHTNRSLSIRAVTCASTCVRRERLVIEHKYQLIPILFDQVPDSRIPNHLSKFHTFSTTFLEHGSLRDYATRQRLRVDHEVPQGWIGIQGGNIGLRTDELQMVGQLCSTPAVKV